MVFTKILDNIRQRSDLDTHSSGSWIRIRIPNGKFSRKQNFSQKLSLKQNFSRKLSRKRKFSKKLSRKRKFLQKYENENFRFNPSHGAVVK
jgi:hypothetical protein